MGTAERPYRFLDSYALVYVLEGRCRYTHEDGVGRIMETGDAFLLFPEIGHRYARLPHERWSQLYIVFDGPVFKLWRRTKLLDPAHFVLRLKPVEYWLERFETVLYGLPQGEEGAMLSACAMQHLLAEAMVSEKPSTIAAHEQDWLARAQMLLQTSPEDSDTTPQTVAAQLHMSYASFRKTFTQLTGQPPGKFRMAALMRQACRWMHENGLSNKELAVRCGFCDEFHFSRRFKQIIGVTPREFRKKLWISL